MRDKLAKYNARHFCFDKILTVHFNPQINHTVGRQKNASLNCPRILHNLMILKQKYKYFRDLKYTKLYLTTILYDFFNTLLSYNKIQHQMIVNIEK